jgi:CO/xanthine dehydrogenase Mo-binding subunit
VAAETKWSSWSGLPGTANLMSALRAEEWTLVGKRGDAAKADAAFASAAKTVAGTYEQPYVRHAPMGAFVALADVRPDGNVTITSQSSNSQGARAHIAHILGVPTEKVVIRWAQGPGQYGRTTYGGDGAMADAAILSKLVGKPVRVQWTLSEDLAWSSVSPASVTDVKVGLDAKGNMVAFRSDWYSPHENDVRMIGALLAGMPEVSPRPASLFPALATVWLYDKVPAALEQAFYCPNLGATSSYGGLRGNIMRTPHQRQQNLALESIVNEAASAAGVDPIEFRTRHTTNAHVIGLLKATAEAARWQPRPSPGPDARRTGTTPVRGRGMGAIIREGSPWVGIAEIEVVPATGVIRVTSFTIGVDVGKVMNPRHLKSNMQGGSVMGLSEALFEEVAFDESKVTNTDWTRYRIARMGDVPEITTVFASSDDHGINGGGETANALGAITLLAALFDATGVQSRRIPLTPPYVKGLLKT